MIHKIFQILTRTCLNMDETIYDSYEPEFADMLTHAPIALAATAGEDGRQPPFVFDMGISMPLFVTVLKCRSPAVRRRALQLQLQCPHIGYFQPVFQLLFQLLE